MNAREIIEEQIPIALKKKPELVTDINAVIHWNITGPGGGTWTMDLTRDTEWISKDFQGVPALTVTMSNDDFVLLRQGRLNGMMAVMNGKLKFTPMNLGLAMKVAKLLS
ncbi:MAG: SCP2 sterol-binding domain-containing protein [Sphingobacteriales bacterium]|nr:MAG: SCP2 sterol-binding domain-containing protein [Sphingobacteriales bacterium]